VSSYRDFVYGLIHPGMMMPQALRQPAYTYTGIIIDTGILGGETKEGGAYYYDCRTSINICDCSGVVIAVRSIGERISSTELWIVEPMYEKAVKQVYLANPAPLTFIDIRSLDQIEQGCCPAALLEQED